MSPKPGHRVQLQVFAQDQCEESLDVAMSVIVHQSDKYPEGTEEAIATASSDADTLCKPASAQDAMTTCTPSELHHHLEHLMHKAKAKRAMSKYKRSLHLHPDSPRAGGLLTVAN